MISELLYALQRGWHTVRQNSKLLFLVVVLFVFPVLFMLVLERFYTVAQANIQTVEKAQVAILHGSIASVLPILTHESLSELLLDLETQETDITTLRVYAETSPDIYTIVASAAIDEQYSTTTPVTLLQLGKVTPDQTFTVPLQDSSGRIEQSVRYVIHENQPYYIFSEHSRNRVDTVLTSRKQDAYILLTLIFAFLIGLAYWINRQVNWERRYQELHGSLKERDLFSNMIAHEFRTPLTAIKGYSSFLQDSTSLSAEERRYVDTIRESAERLVLLVNDFLEIARIQSGKMKLDITHIDLRQTLQSITHTLKQTATEKQLQLVYTPALQAQLINTDQNRLVQVLTNIISNAIKYTDQGTVEISCEASKAGMTIRVKDTGMGISAEDQKKLFTPFARVGGVEHTTTTGTGLGMWITKQMVELLNGSISVESIKGVGTHVVLTIQDVSVTD